MVTIFSPIDPRDIPPDADVLDPVIEAECDAQRRHKIDAQARLLAHHLEQKRFQKAWVNLGQLANENAVAGHPLG